MLIGWSLLLLNTSLGLYAMLLSLGKPDSSGLLRMAKGPELERAEMPPH